MERRRYTKCQEVLGVEEFQPKRGSGYLFSLPKGHWPATNDKSAKNMRTVVVSGSPESRKRHVDNTDNTNSDEPLPAQPSIKRPASGGIGTEEGPATYTVS